MKVEESFRADETASARIERLVEVELPHSPSHFHTPLLPIPLVLLTRCQLCLVISIDNPSLLCNLSVLLASRSA